MNKMLRYEFHKLFRQRSLYICAVVSAAIIILSALSIYLITKKNPIISYTAWSFASTAFSGSSLSILYAIFISIFICDDFASGTIKNIYSRGYCREKVFFGKYIASLTGAFLMFIFTVICAFIAGAIFWEVGEVGPNLKMIAAQIPLVFAYHALFFTVAIIFCRIGASIAISIVCPTMITLGLTIMDTLLKLKRSVSRFWLDNILLRASDSDMYSKSLKLIIGTSVIYTVALVTAGLLINRRKQV